MKKSLVFAMAMALGVTATAFAANPFSDVPAGHWAYAAVAKLAAAGIVDGYPDGTYKGDRTMTRYEMAQIVAKALAKGAIGADDKLVGEFADELDNLGVRVARLEKNADNVKITGSVKLRNVANDGGQFKNGADGDTNYLRTDIFFTGEVNDNWHYVAMLRNQQYFTGENESGNDDTDFQRAYLTGKTELMAQFQTVKEGAKEVPYHADGELCRMYTAEEFTALTQAATAHVFYHRTYCNHLNAWIKRAGLDEIPAIVYGADLPADLAASMAALIEKAGGDA